VCPGYPFQIELDLRIPTASAADVAVQHGPPVQQQGLPPLPTPTSSTISASPVSAGHIKDNTARVELKEIKAEDDHNKVVLLHSTPRQQVESPPRYDIQHQSLCFFVNLFCLQGSKLYSFPILDFVPSLLQESSPGSPLSLAATAVSRMTLADQYSGKDIRLETGRDYGDALAYAARSIRDPTKAVEDETIMTVWLLGTYEAIHAILAHRRGDGARSLEAEWKSHVSHIRGAMNLLKIRGTSQLKTARGEKIYSIFKAAIQMRLFVLNSVTSSDFADMELELYQDVDEFVPSKTANTATSFFHNVARLIGQIKMFLLSEKPPERKELVSNYIRRAIRYAEQLDEDMKDWSKQEDYWDMMPAQGAAKGTVWAQYPLLAQSFFFSPWVYLYWLRFLIARVKLYETLIEVVKYDPSNSTGAGKAEWLATEYQIASYRTRIQVSTSELIGLTAYAIGDVSSRGTFSATATGKYPGRAFQEINVVAALQLVIPLKACLRSEHTTDDQKEAIDLAISQISEGFKRQPLNLS